MNIKHPKSLRAVSIILFKNLNFIYKFKMIKAIHIKSIFSKPFTYFENLVLWKGKKDLLINSKDLLFVGYLISMMMESSLMVLILKRKDFWVILKFLLLRKNFC